MKTQLCYVLCVVLCAGDTVTFSHVDLPKGTFVRLQPVSSAWLVILPTYLLSAYYLLSFFFVLHFPPIFCISVTKPLHGKFTILGKGIP